LPTLSVVRGKEHERWLHCGRCGTGWAFPRVRCPSCGESDHERLGYLHAAGEGEYRRVEVCDGCGCYVKSVALLDPPDADRLLELDLETAALDFVALESGYTRAVSALNRPLQATPAAASSGDTRLV
jgi:FdhE protein